ncbi:hypothetical protein [Brevibacterium album]|uniref:hypothetical protein n=1 Tax=Brevibacterium album TaxID=417948 RepID=UPI0004063D9F|nr:hypothetical protein [Brevibacterium album]
MNKAQIVVLAVLSIAGAVGWIWGLAHLPGLGIVPRWIVALLPAPGTAAAGWFAFITVGTVVLSALALPFASRARKHPPSEEIR